MQFKRKYIATSMLACTTLMMQTALSRAFANDLDWSLGVDNEFVYQNVYSGERKETINAKNYILRPQLSLNFKSKRTSAFWRATHNHVRRNLQDTNITNNYTNYAYGGNFAAIQNLLTFTASGALNYQSAARNGFFVDNFLLNANNLSKTRSNRFGADFTLPRGDYFGHTTTVNYSITESEKRENSFNQLDSNILSLTTSTYTGNDFERFNAQVDTDFSVSERSERGDYKSRRASGNMSYRLISNFGLIAIVNHEANQVQSKNNVFSNARAFNSVGAGFIWREEENKRISVTWNTAENDADLEEEQEKEDNKGYFAADLNWQFTPRTQLSAGYTRRFFGESGKFSFQHRIKRLRTQISYSEEVTSFSRLIAEPESLGVFICSDGIADLSACFQPSSLNYQLQPNEQFIQFNTQNSEINDELILRKALSWQLGTELRRTKVSLNGRYSSNDYLESDRLSRTYSAGTSISFALGQKTNINWTTDAAVTDDIFEGERGKSEVLTSEIGVNRKIGRYFDLSFNFSYLQRETEGRVISQTGSNDLGLRGDIQERRVTLTLKYNLTK